MDGVQRPSVGINWENTDKNLLTTGSGSFGNIDINVTTDAIEMSATSTDLAISVATAANKVHMEDTNLTVENSAFAPLGYSTLVTNNAAGRVGIGAQSPSDLCHLLVPNLGSSIDANMRVEAGNGSAGLAIVTGTGSGSPFELATFSTTSGQTGNVSSWFAGHSGTNGFAGGAFLLMTNNAGLVGRMTIAPSGHMTIDTGFAQGTTYSFFVGSSVNNGDIGANGGAVFNILQGTATTDDVVARGGTDANLFVVDASADTVQVGSAVTADGAKFFVDGKASISQELEVNGAFNHDGTLVGLYGVTPVARPNITGSRGGNAALADLLTKGATVGYWTDSTTA